VLEGVSTIYRKRRIHQGTSINHLPKKENPSITEKRLGIEQLSCTYLNKNKINGVDFKYDSGNTLEGPNVYKNFAFEILDKLSRDEGEQVRTQAEELMRS
jgi:hypothetical protein